MRLGRAIFCLSLWCFGPLSDGSCFKPSLPRGRDVRDKGHKGLQDQCSFVSIYGDHAISVMSSVFRASPRDRWPDTQRCNVNSSAMNIVVMHETYILGMTWVMRACVYKSSVL